MLSSFHQKYLWLAHQMPFWRLHAPFLLLHHRNDLAWTECFDKSDPMWKDSPALLERPRLQQMAETQSSTLLPDRLGIFPLCKCTRDLEIQQQWNPGVSRTSENWTMGTTQGRVPRLAVFDAEVVWVGRQGERVFLSENIPYVFLLTETSVTPPDHRHGALQDITLTHFLSIKRCPKNTLTY